MKEPMSAVDVQAYKAHQAREAAFEQWWNLTIHNGTPRERKALAREAYFAAWGGAARLPDREGWQHTRTALMARAAEAANEASEDRWDRGYAAAWRTVFKILSSDEQEVGESDK